MIFENNRHVPSLRESHPHNEDELEDVVEREPVDSVDGRLKDGQEGVDDPVLPNTSAKVEGLPHLSQGRTVNHCVSSAEPCVNSASSEKYAGSAKPAVLTKNSPAMLKKTRKK